MIVFVKVKKFVESANKKQILIDISISIRVKLFKKLRLGSKPYISGDTFRSISDVKLDRLSDRSLKRASKKIEKMFLRGSRQIIMFIDLHCVLDSESQNRVVAWFREKNDWTYECISIILHNHDQVPPPEFFKQMGRLGIHCYSPNVLDNVVGVTPIPIGLENRYFQKNGIIKYFPPNSASCDLSIHKRHIGLFGAFNIATNPMERQKTADVMSQFGISVFQSRINPQKFRAALSQALFVLSPPGNGIDCHRTWESVYFGAIPVIKKGMLAESLYDSLPILAIDEWDEICAMSRVQLEALYESIIGKVTDQAYFNYWESLIRNK
jgi:hypothetical protein